MESRPIRWTDRSLLVAAAIAFLVQVYVFFGNLDDDAFIPIRYALNFHAGYGWVMNPGERVEATTSPLHLAFVTLLTQFFTIDQTIWVEKLVGTGLGIGVLGLTWKLGLSVFPSRPTIASLGVFLLALRPQLALSMTNGLETGFAVTFLLAALLLYRSESPHRAAIVFALAALARPELVLAFPLVMLMTGVRKAVFLKSLPGFLVPLIAFEIARYLYYGEIVPNTFFAKRIPFGDGLEGGIYYATVHLSWGFFPLSFLLFALPVVGLVIAKREGAFLYAASAVPVLFILLTSGTWMQDGRFAAPALPIFALLWSAALVGGRWASSPSWVVAASVVAIAIFGGDLLSRWQFLREMPSMNSFQDPKTNLPLARWRCACPDGRRMMGDWIRKNVPAGKSIVATEMGVATVMNPDVRFIDLRGLSDRTVARMKRDVVHSNVGVSLNSWCDFDNELLRYALDRKPYAIMAFDGGDGNNPRLKEEYEARETFVMTETYWTVRTWIRRDLKTAQ